MKSLGVIIDAILSQKWQFLAVFFAAFSVSYGLLFALDWLPEPKTEVPVVELVDEIDFTATTTEEALDTSPAAISDEVRISAKGMQTGESMPDTLTIPSLGRTVDVLNPVSRNISQLDDALLHGVVRHPDSAALNQEGNLFILGHSSYLPNVLNKNFQALNGVQNLAWGDTITLQSGDTEYVYQVTKVYKVQASDTTVPIAGVGKKLTLATCNSFGSTDDRYMVEADLVDTKKLAKGV